MFASKNFSLTAPSNNPLGVYTISNSLRFRNSASAYLNRTPGSSGNRNIFTYSFWIKWTGTGGGEIFAVTSGSGTSGTQEDNRLDLNLSSTGTFTFYELTSGSIVCRKTPTQVFRDPGSWYHFVVAIDYTQAVADNRIKMYVNGSQITSFSTNTSPSQNQTSYMNGAGNAHYIGGVIKQFNNFSDQYLAEFNVIDGQALTPSSFGAYNQYGVWQPIKYTGTYGTNGFYLKFNSYATAAALGTDSSGNSNTWTVNNVSVTTGATYDPMTDTPTLTSASAGNYCTLNPLYTNGFNILTISNGNLTASSASGARLALGTFYLTSDKYYFEATCTTVSSSRVGIRNDTVQRFYDSSGNYYDGTSSTAYGATYTSGDVISVAFDLTTQTITFYKNGLSQGQKTSIGLTGILVAPFVYADTSGVWNLNFGQRPFTYTPPSGFVALNTFNLSTPTIPNGAAQMAATTYTGTGATQVVTNTVNGTAMQPDFVWQKSRSAARDHRLMDTNRGINNVLCSDLTQAEYSGSILSSVNSNGFTLNTADQGNNSGETYVAWQWKANAGTNVSNTSGSITSTVSANTTAGFSVVTYTGTNTAATVGHGLGVAPSMIIVKQRNSSVENWLTYHSSLTNPTTSYLYLNSTAAQATLSVYWNGGPTSSVFGIGAYSGINASAGTYVAYVFAAIAGYSAFGSYVGNGSTDGTFVYTGFRPRFVMAKCTSNTTSSTVWTIWDTSRSPYNAVINELFPNLNSAELVDTDGIDILSNGFKPKRNSEYANFSGWTYIYMAFAENPFKYALAR